MGKQVKKRNAPVIALGFSNSSLLTRRSSWAKKSSPAEPLIRLWANATSKEREPVGLGAGYVDLE